MITAITPDILKERTFQRLIKCYLVERHGYRASTNHAYHKELALDVDCLFEFLETTQSISTARLKDIYKDNYRSKVLANLDTNLRSRGTLDVLKHGIKDYGVKLDLAYFKPASGMNPDQALLYNQNILSVTEELNYNEEKRIDLVIFLNGLPIITFELKNAFTGQTWRNAIAQYKNERSGNEKLFMFKQRVVVNFAMDTDEAYMTTRLSGPQTTFLPFNRGNGDSAGNPDVPGKLKTHYIWEQVLAKDLLLEILQNFTYVEQKEETNANGEIRKKERIIFPRYHQLDAVRTVLQATRQEGCGHRYLIQHSAGSGKTNTITWLTHRLASLHDASDQVIFNGVIVVTDRKVLDQQLQTAIYQIEHKVGVVAKIDADSAQLAAEIEKGTKIIISTIQKFRYILSLLSATKGKRYAIVIDEAHSSTSGQSMVALRESLTLDEAAEIASQEEAKEQDVEDKINEELQQFTDTSQLSFFAFTATPKGTTLRLFGRPDESGQYWPFHVYSMRQAIEEGFILDVLKQYLTYKMYYNVNKKIEDDPEFDKTKATRSIVRFVSLHPHNIAQKTEIIIEHFRRHTMKKIGSQAKAMLITASRLHAVRYKLAFDAYIKEHGYTDLKTLVAFSGSLKDKETDKEYRESSMNKGVAETQLPAEFDKDDHRILIVANKYQTGFDQPKLHTMYVDKKLSGVKAVQTLSRLNRTMPGKEDTFVLDFVNTIEDIQESFAPFYRTTMLTKDISPNDIYKLQAAIGDKHVVDPADVMLFSNLFYKVQPTTQDQSIMNNCVDNAVKRTKDFTRDELIEFRSLINRFINFYNLIIQVAPFVDTELHRLQIFLRFLLKKLEVEDPKPIDLTDKVVLQYYKLDKDSLRSGEYGASEGVVINIAEGGPPQQPEKDPLSVIIDRLNQRYGTEFADTERLAVEQIVTSLKQDKNLEVKARANPLETFRLAFEPAFTENVIKEFDKNQAFYTRILTEDDFRSKIIDLLAMEVYLTFNQNNQYG